MFDVHDPQGRGFLPSCSEIEGVLAKVGITVSDGFQATCAGFEGSWLLIAAAAATVAAVWRYWTRVAEFYAKFGTRFRRAFAELAGRSSTAPDISIVVDPAQCICTTVASRVPNGPEGLQIMMRGHVTNLGNAGVLLLHVAIPGFNHDHAQLHVRDHKSGIYGTRMVGPGFITEFSAHIMGPRPGKLTDPFITNVVLEDNFGRKHVVRKVRFRLRP